MQSQLTTTVLRWAAIGLIGAAVVATEARAQERLTSRPSTRAAIKKVSKQKDHPKRQKAVRVRGVLWQPTLDAALTAANKARPAKPIVWFRVLGELEGFA